MRKKPTRLLPEATSNLRFNKGERESFEEYPDVDRPKKRGDCFNEATGEPIGTRPCPFVTCRHNMFLYVNQSGTPLADAGVSDPTEMHPDNSCVLDIVDRNEHGMNPTEMAPYLGISRHGTTIVLESALRNAARMAKSMKLSVPKERNE